MKLGILTFDGQHLIPASADTEDAYAKLKPGQTYSVEVKKARNPGHHRKMFALLMGCFENQDTYDVFEDFMVEVKLTAGHYEEHITTKGKLIYVPKSIDFASMEQAEFDAFYEKVVTVCFEKFGYERSLEFV